MAEHAEWASRLENGSVLVRCVCGWCDQVPLGDVTEAIRAHKPLIPEQERQVRGATRA